MTRQRGRGGLAIDFESSQRGGPLLFVLLDRHDVAAGASLDIDRDRCVVVIKAANVDPWAEDAGVDLEFRAGAGHVWRAGADDQRHGRGEKEEADVFHGAEMMPRAARPRQSIICAGYADPAACCRTAARNARTSDRQGGPELELLIAGGDDDVLPGHVVDLEGARFHPHEGCPLQPDSASSSERADTAENFTFPASHVDPPVAEKQIGDDDEQNDGAEEEGQAKEAVRGIKFSLDELATVKTPHRDARPKGGEGDEKEDDGGEPAVGDFDPVDQALPNAHAFGRAVRSTAAKSGCWAMAEKDIDLPQLRQSATSLATLVSSRSIGLPQWMHEYFGTMAVFWPCAAG